LSLLLVLNELSYRGTEARRAELSDSLHQLVALLHQVKRYRSDVALVTEARFTDLLIGDGYSVREWAGDGRNRDAFRFLLSLRNHAPFADVAPPELRDEADYRYKDRPAKGLGIAHLVGGLAISLRLAPSWEAHWLYLTQQTLAETDAGEVTLAETEVEVRHACLPAHVDEHRQWMTDSELSRIDSGSRLWEARADLFPHLRFLARVRDDLTQLSVTWLHPVKERLAELELAACDWRPAVEAAPQWRSKITPDSDSRKELCRFEDDLDGLTYVFDLHARFTPHAGRLHFRLDRALQRLVIAYIGRKLF
jgi:hypothetical protein